MADYDLKEEQNPYFLKRVRYFDSQLLIDQDFIDDQKYHMDRLRRLLRLLNSPGIAEGLTISATGGLKVKVTAGTALDDLGRLILLSGDTTLTLSGTGTLGLYISFKEVESDPAIAGPVLGNTRFMQSPELSIASSAPSHGIRLGTVTFTSSSQLTVSNDGRLYAGSRMPGPVNNSAPVLRSAGVDAAPARAVFAGELNLSGNTGIGMVATVTPGARLEVVGATADANANALKVSNSANASLLEIKNSGATTVNGDLTVSSLTASGAVYTDINKKLVAGTLPVSLGGTGIATATGVLKGNGTAAVSAMTGTAQRLTRWKDANSLDNSIVSDDGTNLTINGELKFTGNRSITTARGLLMMGTTDGSSAAASEVVGAIGFLGLGQSHGQLSYRVGFGFELVDRSGDGPNLAYTRDSKTYTDLKLRGIIATETVAAKVLSSTTSISATTSISGASVSATGAVSGGSLSTVGAISGATVTASGLISAGSFSTGGGLTASGALSGGSISVSGNASAGTINATTTIAAGGQLSGASLSVTGAVAAASVSTTGTISTNGALSGASLSVSGTVSAGSVSAPSITGTTLAASGALSGGSLSVGGAASVGSLSTSGAVSAGSFSASNGTGTFKTINLSTSPGDPVPVITSRTVPTAQGGANERTELIIFHSNDGDNGAGPDTITLRAPLVRLQTYNDATVSDIDNAAGSNDRLVVFPGGDVGIGYSTTPQAKLDVNGVVRADRFLATNPMRYRMYPENPIVYDDIFAAKNAGVIVKLGTPSYDETGYTSANPWNGRPIIRYGSNSESDGNGAKVIVPAGYDTLWVRVLGDRYNVIKAYFLDGAQESLGKWVGGLRSLNPCNPDGSLCDGSCASADTVFHQWLPIPVGRSGQVALISNPNTNSDFWISGIAFSKNPWNHACMSATGFYWATNGGTATPEHNGNWNRDVLTRLAPATNLELRVPVMGNGKDKLVYLIEHNNNWAGTNHTAVTVNNTPIERFMATYDNPFYRHWTGKYFARYIAARIPGNLLPTGTRWFSLRIDRSKLSGESLWFREIGTHDLEIPTNY